MKQRPLSPALQAVNDSIAERNRRDADVLRAPMPEWERNPQRWAPPAPIPDDPRTCRWCGGQRKEIVPGVVLCQRGCADTDTMPYTGHCRECGKQFKTGKQAEVLCHWCDAKTTREMQTAPHGVARRDEWRERRRFTHDEE